MKNIQILSQLFLFIIFLTNCSDEETKSESLPSKIDSIHSITFPIVDDSLEYFDFSSGKVIVSSKDSSRDKDLAYFFDGKKGLLFGEGKRGDLYNVQQLNSSGNLSEIKEVPESGYLNAVPAIENGIYALFTTEKNYVKLKVLTHDSNYLKFEWVYQPNGTRKF